MSDEVDDVTRMTANVVKSREHVAKQLGIIAQLIEQGCHHAAVEAERLLTTMNKHLDLEEDMLARYEAEAADRMRLGL